MKYFIKIHSIIDVITNSSTELFVIDQSKVEEAFKEVFKILMEQSKWNQFDEETYISKLKHYEKDCNVTVNFKDSSINKSEIYMIEASYHDKLLNYLIENHFNPISENDYEIKYNET